jgi:hypothetical protein
MAWYQTAGWVFLALGVLTAAPGVVKLVARPKSWRVPASLSGQTFSGLMLMSSGLPLATVSLWAWIPCIALLTSSFLVWVNSVRVRRRQKNVG